MGAGRELLLLLLHLLQVNEWDCGVGRLLRALNEHAPIFRDGQLAVEGGRLIAGFNLYSHVKLTGGFAAEDAVGRRNVSIIAPDRGADVAVMRDEVVGGIEADPAEMGQERLNPGVCCVRRGAVVIPGATVKIA